ncbi:hypothetical protein ASPCAL09322 [Aspergillus calidoustus]|uniref:AAA+ ATPase domain-containing protein n=1 Tax=Aspergillus calidoustus TaxID=454130 RepID=A0A0U5GXE4_ASPCI|nr:hypothetical protein ASPCAL09322 [Aspergillus calidoustus]
MAAPYAPVPVEYYDKSMPLPPHPNMDPPPPSNFPPGARIPRDYSPPPTLPPPGPTNQGNPFDLPVQTPNPEPNGPEPWGEPDPMPDEDSWAYKWSMKPKVAEVRWVDYEHWRNRYGEDEGLEIIEVLRGHEHLAQEVLHEHRRGSKRRREATWLKSSTDPDQTWAHRVRIQSAPLMLLLSRLSGHSDLWSFETAKAFFRPFRAFYYLLPQMKACLAILEEKWAAIEAKGEDGENEPQSAQEGDVAKEHEIGAEDDLRSEPGSEPADEKTTGMDPHDAVNGPIADSVTALRHLRKYVEFVEAEVVPMWNRASGTNHRKVRWSDLWMTFQQGELLYVPPTADSSQSSDATKASDTTIGSGSGIKMYQNVWRLYSLVRDKVRDGDPDDVSNNSKRFFHLFAYYIDYDGSFYGPVKHEFRIRDYEGEKDITSLPVYPLRFAKDADKLKAKFLAQGEQFRDLIKKKHLYYDGWTLTHGPMGDAENRPPVISEHIDSEVIVDFVEGYKADATLTPPHFEPLARFDDEGWPKGTDNHPIKQWSDSARSELLGEFRENIQPDEWFGELLKTRHRKESKFMQAWEADGGATSIDGDDLAILPRRVIAYAFRERRFFMVDIESLKEVPVHQNAFKDLQIDKSHKRMVKSLVKSHFRKKDLQKQPASIGMNQDLIKGKGSGLIVLLHGVPGVGKTTTAEAVAQAHKKPLFTITCGDLGFTPGEVETNLRDIFRLAHLWDCVLLLDEADVFLSRRELSDLKRNALVSVFLRVLEYYSGILFLTTNRVGTLDEAFKSRIHVSLYYPPLSEKQTLAIFKVNINRVREIEKEKEARNLTKGRPPLFIDEWGILDFAKWHYRSHKPHERWNGRQIRNAFQIAHSLAQFDMNKTSLEDWDDENDEDFDDQDDEDAASDVEGVEQDENQLQRPLTLNYEQFSTVAETIEKFDLYLYDTMGSTPGDQARTLVLRADDHTWEGGNVYHPSAGSSRGSGYSQPPRRQAQQNPPSRRPGPRKKYQPPTSREGPPSRESTRQSGTPRPRRTPQVSDAPPARGSPLGANLRPNAPVRRRDDSGYSGWSTNPRTPDRASVAEDDYTDGEEYPEEDAAGEQGYPSEDVSEEEQEEGYEEDRGYEGERRRYRPGRRR